MHCPLEDIDLIVNTCPAMGCVYRHRITGACKHAQLLASPDVKTSASIVGIESRLLSQVGEDNLKRVLDALSTSTGDYDDPT